MELPEQQVTMREGGTGGYCQLHCEEEAATAAAPEAQDDVLQLQRPCGAARAAGDDIAAGVEAGEQEPLRRPGAPPQQRQTQEGLLDRDLQRRLSYEAPLDEAIDLLGDDGDV